jgi:hypothetical protein
VDLVVGGTAEDPLAATTPVPVEFTIDWAVFVGFSRVDPFRDATVAVLVGAGVLVGVLVAAATVDVGDTAVALGGTGVAVGGTGVVVARIGVSVGTGVLVGMAVFTTTTTTGMTGVRFGVPGPPTITVVV